MSIVSRLGLLSALIATSLPATTLEQLSLDDMIAKSTGIVRAKVTSSRAEARGASIYTFYRVEVSETWKGTAAQRMEVAVPGGVVRGVRQVVAGAPVLTPGEEYVLFLWTSRSGLSQVIGMSQGMFHVRLDAAGNPTVMRAASTETMVDRSGRPVEDRPVSAPVSELRARVGRALEAAQALEVKQ